MTPAATSESTVRRHDSCVRSNWPREHTARHWTNTTRPAATSTSVGAASGGRRCQGGDDAAARANGGRAGAAGGLGCAVRRPTRPGRRRAPTAVLPWTRRARRHRGPRPPPRTHRRAGYANPGLDVRRRCYAGRPRPRRRTPTTATVRGFAAPTLGHGDFDCSSRRLLAADNVIRIELRHHDGMTSAVTERADRRSGGSARCIFRRDRRPRPGGRPDARGQAGARAAAPAAPRQRGTPGRRPRRRRAPPARRAAQQAAAQPRGT